MYQAGTVAELQELKLSVPGEVYQEALDIVTMLDEQFGADREVEFDEGGLVIILVNEADLEFFNKHYLDLEDAIFEYVQLIKSDKGDYLYVFYFYGYDYGINLFLPMSIAPESISKEALEGANETERARVPGHGGERCTG